MSDKKVAYIFLCLQASFVWVIVNAEKCTQPIYNSLLIYKVNCIQDFVLQALEKPITC